MFKDLSGDQIKDLLDLKVSTHAADGDSPASGPTCGVCLCCYGGSSCCG